MKKVISLLLAVCLLLATGLSLNVLAAETKTFTDTMEDNYPLVYDKSDILRFENNADLELTFYLKWGETATSSVKEEVYAIWKVDGDISAFTLDVKLVNGLGDPNEITVEVSSDCENWQKVEFTYPEPTFDDDIYFNYDMAYWLMTTLSNKNSIPSGCSYIKVTLEPYANKDSANWNIALDTLNVDYITGGGKEEPSKTPEVSSKAPEVSSKAPEVSSKAPEVSSSAPTSTPVDEVSSFEEESASEEASTPVDESSSVADEPVSTTDEVSSEAASETESDAPAGGDSEPANLTWLWIVLAVVVVAGGGAVAFFLLKKKA